MGSEARSGGSLSGAAPSPCPESDTRGFVSGVGAAPSVVAVRRELRELTQEITPLIGYLADLSESRKLVEWAWLFDELHDHAESIQSHAMALKHMADIAWERTYKLGREDEDAAALPDV
jgi:hypothetical protein